jgi:hypothetical protein
MESWLIIEFVAFGRTVLDVVKMEVEDLRESRPEDENWYFFECWVENIQFEYFLHLQFALFIHLDHYEDRIQIEKVVLADPLEFVDEVFAHDLTEDFVEKESLLGLITELDIEKFKNKDKFLSHRIRYYF